MSDCEFELSDVEKCLAERRQVLRFPSLIEAAFQAHAGRYQARAAIRTIVPTVLAYNIFLVVDYLLFPETFWLAAALHGVITPFIIGAALAIVRQPAFAIREALSALVPCLMIAQVLAMYALHEGSEADQYQFLTIGILVHMNVSHRLDHRFAVGATATMLVLYLGLVLGGGSALAVKLIGGMSALAVAFVTLNANRRMERETRFSFLSRLADQMRREEAQAAADKDPLTGLWNRRHLDLWLRRHWNDPKAADSTLTIAMLDVDHFKAFNDRYGHPIGDLCLKRVSATMVAELRSGKDLAVRVGGEEFMLLLPDTKLNEGIQIAERVRRSLESHAIPQESFGPSAVVTASIGLMAGEVGKHSPAELIAGADAALYAAKRNGRNRVWPPLVKVDRGVTRLRSPRVVSLP